MIARGALLEEGRLPTNRRAFELRFTASAPLRVIIEAGTYSPWVSPQLSTLGHDVVAANPQRLRAIAESIQKTDGVDARTLADLGSTSPTASRPSVIALGSCSAISK